MKPKIETESGFYIEPHWGINYSSVHGNPSMRQVMYGEGPTDIHNAASGFGPSVGVTAGYRLSSVFGAAVGLDYHGYNAVGTGTTMDSEAHVIDTREPSVYYDEPVEKHFRLSLSYLSLSVMGTVRVSNLFAFAGPVVSVPTGSAFTETFKMTNDTTIARYFLFSPDETLRIIGDLDDEATAAIQMSVKVGLGYVVQLDERLSLVPSVSANLGMGDLFSKTGTVVYSNPLTSSRDNRLESAINTAMRMTSMQASIGLRFKL